MKNNIAKNINHKAKITRIITTNYELDFVEGEIYNNQGKAESWADSNINTQAFSPETKGEFTYLLVVNDVPCHLVDYNNQEEVKALGAENCNSEGEVLVSENAIFEIVEVPYCIEGDMEEVGYATIELKFIGFRK